MGPVVFCDNRPEPHLMDQVSALCRACAFSVFYAYLLNVICFRSFRCHILISLYPSVPMPQLIERRVASNLYLFSAPTGSRLYHRSIVQTKVGHCLSKREGRCLKSEQRPLSSKTKPTHEDGHVRVARTLPECGLSLRRRVFYFFTHDVHKLLSPSLGG